MFSCSKVDYVYIFVYWWNFLHSIMGNVVFVHNPFLNANLNASLSSISFQDFLCALSKCASNAFGTEL